MPEPLQNLYNIPVLFLVCIMKSIVAITVVDPDRKSVV
jgi:hypothetical protein